MYWLIIVVLSPSHFLQGLPIYHIETMEMVFTENDRQGVNTERTDHFMRSTFGQYLLVSYK